MEVTEIYNLKDIISLRQLVLHPHGDISKVSYERDHHPETKHYGCYKDSKLIATGTLIPEDENEVLSESIYRIRGMAVDPHYQGQHLGQKILNCMFKHLTQKTDTKMIWCNARVKALGLYTRAGFIVFEPEFDIPGSGPHKRLRLVFT